MFIRNTAFKTTAIALAIASLVACGGGGDDDPAPGDGNGGDGYGNETPTPTPEPTPDPTPDPGGSNDTLIEKSSTAVGDSFTLVGDADVLVPGANDGEFDVSTQTLTGRTLYVFDSDAVGESACVSTGCITNWPALIADESAQAQAPFSIVQRGDGTQQWALRDKPLYLFAGDSAAGDVNGEGIGGVWHVAVSQPVALNTSDISAAEGDYLVAYGRVQVSSQVVTDEFTEEALDRTGFALYTFDNDDAGISNCFGNCLAAWPALMADANDTAEAPYSIIERQMDANGATGLQWAYHGKPLYFFAGDTAVGETSGKDIPNWRLARPEPWKVADSVRGSALVASGLARVAAPNSSDEEETQTLAKNGFTLYTFDNDTAGVSNCSGSCLSSWPALMANEGAEAQAPYSLIERSTGELQWALNGLPLYFFAGDSSAGDVNGDEVGGVWHIARSLPVVVSTHPEEEEILVAHGDIIDENGEAADQFQDFTVYIFTDDDAGLPTCFGSCAVQWPPLFAPADAQDFGDFTVVAHDDPNSTADDDANLRQWAYKGQPLYFFVGDSAPGDVTGEYGTWFIARP